MATPHRNPLDAPPGVHAAIAINFDGDVQLYHAFAASCAEQFTHDISAGQTFCDAGDLLALRRLAHNLKSALTMLGHDDLFVVAQSLESQAAAGDLPSARASWRVLHADLPRVAVKMTTSERVMPPGALKILYVEDFAPAAALVRETLSLRAPEIQVEIVSTVAQAIERLNHIEGGRGAPYDVVLTDLNLPDGLGLEILSHVRSHHLMLAVLILTSSVEEEALQAARQAGADGFIAKRGDYLARLPRELHRAALSVRHSTTGERAQSRGA